MRSQHNNPIYLYKNRCMYLCISSSEYSVIAIAAKARLLINLHKFAWTDKTASFWETLMFTKSFSGIKCWSHKSAIAYVLFCSYMKYEVAKEQINYLWVILYSNKEWLNGGTHYFESTAVCCSLNWRLSEPSLRCILSFLLKKRSHSWHNCLNHSWKTCHRFLQHSPTNLPYL